MVGVGKLTNGREAEIERVLNRDSPCKGRRKRIDPEDRKGLATHKERESSVPEMVKNSVPELAEHRCSCREKGALTEVSHPLGVKELMVGDGRGLEKGGDSNHP